MNLKQNLKVREWPILKTYFGKVIKRALTTLLILHWNKTVEDD